LVAHSEVEIGVEDFKDSTMMTAMAKIRVLEEGVVGISVAVIVVLEAEGVASVVAMTEVVSGVEVVSGASQEAEGDIEEIETVVSEEEEVVVSVETSVAVSRIMTVQVVVVVPVVAIKDLTTSKNAQVVFVW